MWARATRLEFIIVSIALVVLLMCSKPPRSGNADVADFHAPEVEPVLPAEPATFGTDPNFSERDIEENAMSVTSDNTSADIDVDDAIAPPPAPRIAAVDARACDRLDYQNVMYGHVTVRWVWNGTRFVPHKVCVVEEEDGTRSVWSFDQQSKASLSELSPGAN